MIFLFVWGFCPTRDVFTHVDRLSLKVKSFDLPLTIFRQSHPVIWNICLSGHLRRPVTLTSVADSFSLGLPVPVLTT